MKKTVTKLVFKRETLKILSDHKLTQVAGGGNSDFDDGCTVPTLKLVKQSADR
jgi:hypothetical protein